MSLKPTISACVAVYNGADLLPRALESIRAQTVPCDEIIVVDDGSSDGSADVAEDLGVRVIRQANAGIGAARRRLVQESQGEWIAFCDHDDWWEPTRIERTLAATGADVGLVYSGVWHVDERGVETPYPLHRVPDAPTVDHLVPDPEDIWTSSTLLRRDLVLEAGNFRADLRAAEDMLMWFQIGARSRIVQVPERLVHMTRRSNSTSAPSLMPHETGVRIYEEFIFPAFAAWFPADPATTESRMESMRRKVGHRMSILANWYDLAGRRSEARAMHCQALRYNPRSKGVWYRYARHALRLPGRPPI